MSELSYLEKLLDGAKVEWKPLAEVCRFINGRAYKQEELLSKGKYPVLRVGNFFTNQNWYYSDLELDPDKYCDNGDLLYAWSASFGPRIWENGKSIYHYHIWKVVPDFNLVCKQFLYYLLQWDTKALKDAHSTGSTMMHISKAAIEKRLVPIPCPSNPEKSLAIQSEIVRILDTFTALTAELNAELNARKKQYNYYRDQLLSFEEGEVQWKTLGEVAKYSKTRIGFDKLDKTNYVGVDNLLQNRAGKTQSNYVPTSGNLTEFLDEDILIGNIRPYLKKIWQSDCIGGTNGDVLVIRCCDGSVFSRYLYQVLADDSFFEYNMQHARGAKMPRGDKDAILKYRIPVPAFDEQKSIVSILDKFDTLTNSIEEGLPREIALRQQQYEYYRDLLFSFPNLQAPLTDKPEATARSAFCF
ncbi:restriction endonuclease subunit S [Ewingella sp. AOP8-B2-18]|uniref:restriction endonuclease subunit S n=1 Tax=Ewingella docleensis TaxID=3118588 RepID=UPI0033656E4A